MRKQLILTFILIFSSILSGQDIYRFEHFDSQDGLSQNTVSSILCDKNGFLWIGTMNGLNRYDGYNFKVYKGQTQNQNFFTNNRVIDLWQDSLGFIWLETYDHYFHYFNAKREAFRSIPDYNDPQFAKIKQSSCFLQYSNNEIWIGTEGRGTYFLKYQREIDSYVSTQISDKGRYNITNNNVRFIIADEDSSVWVGTQKGINLLKRKTFNSNSFEFQHLFINYSFTSAIETQNEIWFSTKKSGIIIFDKKTASYHFLNSGNTPQITNNEILKLYKSKQGHVFIALKNEGVLLFDSDTKQWSKLSIKGNNVDHIYFDLFNNAWITTEVYGVNKINLTTLTSESFQLTEQKQKAITDQERHVFYEDRDSNLWIGLHGGALAFYNRKQNIFNKYINNPSKNYSISSNIVHCIKEDNTGLMWLGTGQYKGGLEKVIKRNEAFQHLLPKQNLDQITDNLVRALVEDPNKCIWVGTKSGELYIYNKDLKPIGHFGGNKFLYKDLFSTNVYSLFIDHNKHIWIGTKGEGLFISKEPIPDKTEHYKQIQFYHYRYNSNDSASLASNNVYSIEQDQQNNIWIGTYGNGVCKTSTNYESLSFHRYNSNNSQLSNDLVRKVKVDSDSNLWVGTSFGLNILYSDSIKQNNIQFKSFFKDINNPDLINYNDVVEIYEDSKRQIWFGTFGGGVNLTKLPISQDVQFETLTSNDGLSNDVVFGIVEDKNNRLWLSTEYGLNRYDQNTNSFEIFNESNGLSFNNFSENTCYRLNDGRLLFGGSNGVEIISPELIRISSVANKTQLTNFQLFNKDVVVGEKKSPLTQSISFTEKVTLTHLQSSFSIEYSSLDFLDPGKIQYAFILDGFESEWNYVGNQTKATYTNLPNGVYTFRVKNTNRAGHWNNEYRELTIEILPPWWKTTLAYLAYAVFLFGIFFTVRFIISQIHKYRNDLLLEKKINELKLRFFTNISHEIRTPLTLILGPLEDILNENSISEDIKKQLILMRKNTKRMLQLINQLLDFRRIQNNKMSLKIQSIDLNEFTQNIFNSFIPLAKHNGITFKFIPFESKVSIWADIIKLDSIIYNLISNALKYTPKGKNVTVSVHIDPLGKYAKVNVKDEGPGIPNENISDIFTRYVILNNQNNMSSGIGLSLAFELAKMHAGNIDLKSEVGKGSSFCFSIPLDREKILKQNANTTIEEQTEDFIQHHEEFGVLIDKLKIPENIENAPAILLVEDNPQISNYIKDKLSSYFKCYTAENGLEGLKKAEMHNPDIIVTDIMMPQMDGIEMTKKLKDNFSTCHIPVIMMTAKSDIQDQISGYETGAEAYITKPLNSNYLIAVINSLIKQRKLVIAKYRDNKTIDPKTLKVNTKDEEFMDELLNYVQTNYAQDLSIETVAEHCCVSRTVLYNKIKGLTGLSPLEFIRQIKLKIALELLQKGYSVSDAAFKIGYSDVKYFSKQFKMMFGYPPSQVKKDLQSNAR